MQCSAHVCKQIKWTPIGSPVSGVNAEAVLQNLEAIAMSSYRPRFWAWYNYDTIVIMKRVRLASIPISPEQCFPRHSVHYGRRESATTAFSQWSDPPSQRWRRFGKRLQESNLQGLYSSLRNQPFGDTKIGCFKALFNRIDTHCSTPESMRNDKQRLQKSSAITDMPSILYEGIPKSTPHGDLCVGETK